MLLQCRKKLDPQRDTRTGIGKPADPLRPGGWNPPRPQSCLTLKMERTNCGGSIRNASGRQEVRGEEQGGDAGEGETLTSPFSGVPYSAEGMG